MQKVEGSSPFIRFQFPRKSGFFGFTLETCVPVVSPFAQEPRPAGVRDQCGNGLEPVTSGLQILSGGGQPWSAHVGT